MLLQNVTQKLVHAFLTPLLYGFRVGQNDVFLAILTHFWSSDHFDSQGGGFKVIVLLIINAVKKT